MSRERKRFALFRSTVVFLNHSYQIKVEYRICSRKNYLLAGNDLMLPGMVWLDFRCFLKVQSFGNASIFECVG